MEQKEAGAWINTWAAEWTLLSIVNTDVEYRLFLKYLYITTLAQAPRAVPGRAQPNTTAPPEGGALLAKENY